MARRSPSIPLAQLAHELGYATEEFRSRVQRAGLTRLLRQDGSVGLDVVDQVADGARRAGTASAPVAEDADLDQLMRSAGVTPLDARPTPRAAPGRPVRAVGRAAAPRNPQPAAARSEHVEALEAALARVEGERDAIKASLDSAEQRSALHAQELAAVRAELAAVHGERDKLGAAAAEQDAPLSEESLAGLLTERGLRGSDERSAAIRALIDARRWSGVEGELGANDPVRTRVRFDRELVLHCGEEDCPPLHGAALVRVSRDRCELCDGRGRDALLRQLSEEMLLAGRRRLLVLGTGGALRTVLQELDERIVVQTSLVDGPGEVVVVSVDARLTEADVQVREPGLKALVRAVVAHLRDLES